MRRILDAVPGGVVHVAKDGSIVGANEQALRIVGRSFEELSKPNVGAWIATMVREDGSPCTPENDCPVAKVFTTREASAPETLGLRRSDGDLVWAVFRAVPVNDANGAITGAIVSFIDITLRKRTEERLRVSEQRWRSLAENIPDFVVIADSEGRILSTNRIVPPLREAAILGSRLESHVDAEARADYRRTFTGALSTRAPTRIETWHADSTGARVWYDVIFVPLFDEGSDPRVLVVARDVTKRKLAEEQLHRSEQMWRSLGQNIPDYAVIIDKDGKFLRVNRVRPGVTEAEVLGKSMFDYVEESQRPAYEAAFHESLASGETRRIELDARGSDGVVVHYEVVTVPLIEADAVERVLVVARDMTEQRHTEELIRASEQRWRALVDSLPDTVFVVDRERRILSINEAAGAKRGPDRYKLEDVLGAPCDVFVDEGSLDDWRAAFANVLETGAPARLETRGRSGPAVRSWYDSIMVPLTEGGAVTRVMIVARDITDRRAMLASLAEKERLASVGMVAASVAHEIMNPLTYVLANLDFALGNRPMDDARRTRALTDAREGAKRMQQIVWDLRSLGRAGGEELFYVDARSVLESALRLSGPEVGRAARVVLDLQEVPGVLASESRLCQVFINLLVNAAQSMAARPLAEREIHVRTRHDDAAGMVAVSIADKGVGIPRERLERIFEPFYTTKESGTGLGLSISRDIVERMGGHIAVESTPGSGTTFTVWLSTTRSASAAVAE